MRSRSLPAHLLLLVATFFWGATFLIVKDALQDASPLWFNAARMSLASLVLLVLFFRSLRRLSRGAFGAGFAIGTSMWLGYECQTVGLVYTTASKAAFLTGLSVVWVPLLLALFWRRRIRRSAMAGALLALVGLYLLCVPASAGLAPQALLATLNRGDLLSLACAVAFALQVILVSRSAEQYHFTQTVPVQITVCAFWMLLSIPLAEPHGYLHGTSRLLGALAIMALLCTVACFLVQNWAQQFTPPTHAALIYALEPVFAALTSYWFAGERLGGRGLLGGALVLAGVLASELLGQATAEELDATDHAALSEAVK